MPRRFDTFRLSILTLVVLFHGSLMAGCSWARTKTPTRKATATVATPPQQLMLEVKESLGLRRNHWPVTAGVPFPRGAVKDVSQLRLGTPTAPTPLQSRVLSRWPDGSARWVLLDWQADLAPHQSSRVQLVTGAPAAPSRAVKLTTTDDGISVDTGPLQFVVPRKRFAVMSDVQVNGKPITTGPIGTFFNIDGKRVEAQPPSTVTVTEAGPLRARIELRGRYASAFEYVIRIDAFAGQPWVRVFHTFEQHNPDAYTLVRQIGIEVPLQLKEKASYRIGREKGAPLRGALPASGVTLVQPDNTSFRAAGVRRQGHAAGWVDLSDAAHGVAVAARFFWQEYPQGFELRSKGLTYNLWAPQAPPAKVGMGAAKTHEMVLYFHDKTPPAPAELAALSQPLLATLDPRWVVASGALRNAVAPNAATTPFLRELAAGYRRYQAHAVAERWDDSGAVHCPAPDQPRPERPRLGFFGMFNWGDWNFPGYHDTTKGCDAWGNLEYDMAQVLALAYAATGEPGYYEGMVAAARHFMDVDVIHYAHQHSNWTGMNHPKNPLHFTFELGSVDLGHTWTEGLLSYYYLTGDERGLEAARGIADYLVRRLRAAVVLGNPRQWGWPQIALVAVYEATGDASYLDAAREYARGGMAGHPPHGGKDWKMGILAEALCYTHSVTQDAAIRDWLTRYAAAVQARGGKVDPRFLPALAYVGRINGHPEYEHTALATAAHLKFGGWAKPFTIAGRLGFSILSATADAE